MPKRSAADKAATHQEILRQASEAFRKAGGGVGIGEVMKELGLTHGGFYRHFASKDELFLEATALALREIADRLDRIATAAPPGQQTAAIISAYLSPEHLDHPETWCAIAAMAPDIARQSPAVRQRLDASLQYYLQKLTPHMPGADVAEKSANFLVLISGMAGAIALLRSFGNQTNRDKVLHLLRGYYLKTFGS